MGMYSTALGNEARALSTKAVAIGYLTQANVSGVAIGAGANNYLMSGQFNGEVGGSDGFLNFYTPATIINNGAANVPFTVKGAAAQSANLQEWKDSAGTTLASVKVDNNIHSTLMVSGTIVSNAADAARVGVVSIGSGAVAGYNDAVVIGNGATAGYSDSVTIGKNSKGTANWGENAIAIGIGCTSYNLGIAMGLNAVNKATESVSYTHLTLPTKA